MKLRGNLIDLFEKRIYGASIQIENGIITAMEEEELMDGPYFLPGLTDAHIHIESSMLTPSQFAPLALKHGCIATVSDPHEIANVLGLEGVEFMLEDASKVPFYFNFGAPSCVPATNFETAGATIDSKGIRKLLERDDIKYLAEMMNFPGVLQGDPEVMAKIAAAKELGKPVDGHAPGLRGEDALRYIQAGISTDHECFTFEEGLDKLKGGMKVLIREGSAARNFEALIDLIDHFPDKIMFCSDDKHPDDLLKGHLNELYLRARMKGKDMFQLLRAMCIHPHEHYGLEHGLLRAGDSADFIAIDHPDHFNIMGTWIKGERVVETGEVNFKSPVAACPNNFSRTKLSKEDFNLTLPKGRYPAISVLDGQIVTESFEFDHPGGELMKSDRDDLVYIALVNRYKKAPVSLALVKNTGLKEGAFASCVAHDSHNIVVVGSDKNYLKAAANLIVKSKGGIAAVSPTEEQLLPLPVAGIMSEKSGEEVAEAYEQIDAFVKKELKVKLQAPFMSLSFMALLVIPKIKISDKGLFDGGSFDFVYTV